MTKTPVPALPDFTQTFTMETNANIANMGVVLQQKGHPIAYISKASSPRSRAATCVGERTIGNYICC